MEIISVINDDKTIIDVCLETVHKEIKYYQEDDKLLLKIVSEIQSFLKYQILDTVKVKNVEDSVYEFRISIPNSNYLLRIFFHWEKNTLVLLTGHLVKPKSYTDTYSTHQIEKAYTQCITTAQTIIQDFKNEQSLSYRSLRHLLTNYL
jgi:hypothetical protein